MAASAEILITARLRPEFFAERGVVSIGRSLVVAALVILVLVGFGLRQTGLSAEGLSEDELNKLQAVGDYRRNGLTSANSEHPLLMKALQTASVVVADRWNATSFGSRNQISTETALRFPGALFGALIALLIYLIVAELFGAEVGLIAAALWAFDPAAIGLNRIAKEDTFLVFFFLLANVFWLRGQRVAESQPQKRPEKYYWLAGAAFGAMLASKYLPQLLAISIGYYWLFQRIPETRWRLGKKRMLTFFAVMGITFLIVNPTILFPATWKQMGLFAGQKLVGHDGYEFMGKLYSHKMTNWINGIPWYFYHLFLAIKLPLLTVAGFLVGLPLLFRRRTGDGRYFIIIWLFFWVMTFCFPGGKFTRYFTTVLPAVLITSALGIQFAGQKIAEGLASLTSAQWPKHYVRPALALVVVVASLVTAINAAPHFRLYTNALGTAFADRGYYFPHDEFYDASMRDAVFEIARHAKPGATVVSEVPTVAAYYAQRANRPDLVSVLLSDSDALKQLKEGDFLIDARGRRYFSNEAVTSTLRQNAAPTFSFSLDSTPSAVVYVLDKDSLETVLETARRLPPIAKTIMPRFANSESQ